MSRAATPAMGARAAPDTPAAAAAGAARAINMKDRIETLLATIFTRDSLECEPDGDSSDWCLIVQTPKQSWAVACVTGPGPVALFLQVTDEDGKTTKFDPCNAACVDDIYALIGHTR